MLAPGRALCAALVTLVCAAASPAGAAWLEYLHVEANEGGSSGGHVAIRFDDRSYHFQNRGGRLLLLREDSQQFVHDYALLENRSIHVSRVAIDADTRDRLRERFEARRHAQERQLALEKALREERELLERLAARAEGKADAVAVRGAGYLEGGVAATPASRALAALRDAVEREHGADFPARRRGEIERALGALDPDATPDPPRRVDRDAAPPSLATFALATRELLAAHTALDRLAGATRLRPGSFRAPADATLRLAPEERRQLRQYAARLEARLVGLVAEPHLDWGFPLLVGMARLAAIEASLAADRWVLLDSFDPEAPRIDAGDSPARRRALPRLLAEARARLDAARRDFLATADERRFAALEDAANRQLELARAAREGGSLRVQATRLVPSRSARRSDLPLPAFGAEDLAHALGRASERERRYGAALDRAHGYHLLARNCVTELFDTLYSAFDAPEAEALQQLGGYVDPKASLQFIPALSAAAVNRRYRVVERERVPSFRSARLAELSAREHPLRVALRESNTLSSTLYARTSLDSFFLFFTEEALALRPLLGLFNLAAGLGETGWGLLRAPVDGGRIFVSGLRGMAMSLPELAFVNIRKGTNEYIAASRPAPEPDGAQ